MAFVPIYILILGFTIVIDYFAGILLENSSGKKKKWYLVSSLIANIGVLAIFKYFNFANDALSSIFQEFGSTNPVPYLKILLPIGLSFHTFQAMSYTIEVYRGNQKAEKHFGIYALYVMFYPQLVAGPIERPQNLLHQFRENHNFDYQRITDGLKLMAWGLIKKVIIADRLAVIVDNVFDNPMQHTGFSFIIASVFFSFQIFCDFSGYSDMAIGAAQVMGFKLMKNFDRPYLSKSIHEFWSRWHISLTTWFKDYLYITIGGNRVSIPRWYLNLFIVFVVSGLWHGANWTFVAWGALHGFYMIFALITKNMRRKTVELIGLTRFPRIYNGIQIVSTFSLVTFALIFFRAKSISDALIIIKRATIGLSEQSHKVLHNIPLNLNLGVTKWHIAIGILAILTMETIHILQNKISINEWIKSKPTWFRWSIYYSAVIMIIFLGVYEKRQFIYFQF